jgi:glycerol-3-phosphate O-acyltransferase
MNEINRVTAVTPGALVAIALLSHGRRAISDRDLMDTCRRFTRSLRATGARFTPSLRSHYEADELRSASIREALDLYVRAGHVTVHVPGDLATKAPRVRTSEDAVYLVPDEARLSLALSKNIVVHFFVARALVATALLAPAPSLPEAAAPPLTGLAAAVLAERVQTLSKLFKYEFLFRADTSFAQIFDETIKAMEADGEIVVRGGIVDVSLGDGAVQIALYAELVRSFLESYRIAARSLALLLKGPLALKDLTKRALALGERMFLANEVLRREAVSRPVIENACSAFADQGYLTRSEGKLLLAPSYATADAVKTIEIRVALYLPKAP